MLVKCLECSKEFNTPPSRVKLGKGKFCSLTCYKKRQSTHTETLICAHCGREYKHQKSQMGIKFCSMRCKIGFELHKHVQKRCLICGNPFLTYKHREAIGRGKFCSSVCYWKSLELPEDVHKVNLKKRLHVYRFGGNRDKALQRDGFRCTECGSSEDLVIHHIDGTGYKSVGFKRMNNSLSNLLTLCRSCHSVLHNKKKHEDIV